MFAARLVHYLRIFEAAIDPVEPKVKFFNMGVEFDSEPVEPGQGKTRRFEYMRQRVCMRLGMRSRNASGLKRRRILLLIELVCHEY